MSWWFQPEAVMRALPESEMNFTLFDEEERLLELGECIAETLADSGAEAAPAVLELALAYGKLLKTTKKLVRISDRNEDKLNRLGKELAIKNEQLEKQTQELIKAAALREDVDRITRHDLKNPLQNILAVPELLLMTLELEDYQRDMLKRVEEAGYTMLNMINLSLDLFKMEQGTYALKAEDVDLAKVLRKIVSDQEPIWNTKEISVDFLLDGSRVGRADAYIVIGEELLCYSMFSNLIRNALDASPEQEKLEIAIDTAKGLISIHNMGAVPEDVRERFFEKYATSGKQHGTGLGTYSAKLIAEVHGGSIAMESSDLVGTVVTVSLPAR